MTDVCGSCCHYVLNGKFKKCKNLIRLESGNTLCRIYNNRLGSVIDKCKYSNQIVRCTTREVGKYDYYGCPLNTNKPKFLKETVIDITK